MSSTAASPDQVPDFATRIWALVPRDGGAPYDPVCIRNALAAEECAVLAGAALSGGQTPESSRILAGLSTQAMRPTICELAIFTSADYALPERQMPGFQIALLVAGSVSWSVRACKPVDPPHVYRVGRGDGLYTPGGTWHMIHGSELAIYLCVTFPG